jgi:hypothetical protein
MDVADLQWRFVPGGMNAASHCAAAGCSSQNANLTPGVVSFPKEKSPLSFLRPGL